jgi:hypothetical protein
MTQRLTRSSGVVSLILILQLIPLIIFPTSSFSLKSQEWWLPVLLGIMVLAADFQIIVRRTTSQGPWYLLAFAQGFNFISRLMMVWPHATTAVGKVNTPNWPYIVITLISMGMSLFMLWFIEQPEVRMNYLPK